jgi:hypothetical protein
MVTTAVTRSGHGRWRCRFAPKDSEVARTGDGGVNRQRTSRHFQPRRGAVIYRAEDSFQVASIDYGEFTIAVKRSAANSCG